MSNVKSVHVAESGLVSHFDPEAFDPVKATKRMWRDLPDWRSERWV